MRKALRLACLGLTLVPLLAASARSQDQNPVDKEPAARDLTAVPVQRIALDFRHYYTQAQLAQALTDLATAYPEALRVESLGKSRQGSDILVATLGWTGGLDLASRPALLLISSPGESGRASAELALFCLHELLRDQSRDPAVARLLKERTLYVIACLDPDQRGLDLEARQKGTASQARAVDLDHDFPALWEEGLGLTDQSAYPLFEPESRALCEFLLTRPAIAAVACLSVLAAPASPREPALEGTPDQLAQNEAAASLRSRVLAHCDLRTLFEQGRRPGSLLEYVWRERGAFAFELTAAHGQDRTPALERAAFGEDHWPSVNDIEVLGRDVLRRTLDLAESLPQVTLTLHALTRLKGDQWQVDLKFTNSGVLPTASSVAHLVGAVSWPRLEIAGAELVAAAVKHHSATSFSVEHAGARVVALPELGQRSQVDLRLVVAGASRSGVVLTLTTARAGRAEVKLILE